ncbi:MAG TPA: TerC family protein [Desulfobacteria bacterium]|nr:TerC family protein [Desulfobacteria bacterium]
MEFLSSQFLSALFALVIIDLVLAGDNAIVIGLAARNLPKHQQTKAILWGTFGAVAVRVAATLAVVWLLKIPGLMLLGGLLLIRIAYNLLAEEKSCDVKECNSLWVAIRTIIIADAVMGLDNVLGVAGAAHGDFRLVIMGLLISVPIVVWGSTLVLKLIERFPVVVQIGAGVLAWTAGKMITDEPFIKVYFEHNIILKWAVMAAIIAGVLIYGRIKSRQCDIPKEDKG